MLIGIKQVHFELSVIFGHYYVDIEKCRKKPEEVLRKIEPALKVVPIRTIIYTLAHHFLAFKK